jgi:hypothetical protein
MTFKATEDQPAVMSQRAKRVGESRAHVTWHEPLEGTERLLTALIARDHAETGRESRPFAANQRLPSGNVAHVLVRQSCFR